MSKIESITLPNGNQYGVGHTIMNSSGTSFTGRSNVQFEGATITDDSTNDKTVVSITGGSGSAFIIDSEGYINLDYDKISSE